MATFLQYLSGHLRQGFGHLQISTEENAYQVSGHLQVHVKWADIQHKCTLTMLTVTNCLNDAVIGQLNDISGHLQPS